MNRSVSTVLIAVVAALIGLACGSSDSTGPGSTGSRLDSVRERCAQLVAAGAANCVTEGLRKGAPESEVDELCSQVSRAFMEQCLKNGGM
jgi:hypothetical protein